MDAPSTIQLLKVTGIRRALARAIRLCKQHGCQSNKREGWKAAVKSGGETLASVKAAANEEARARFVLATTLHNFCPHCPMVLPLLLLMVVFLQRQRLTKTSTSFPS